MTPRFSRAADIVLGHEGGLANDTNDRGGMTKFGISQRAYPTLQISTLTIADARAIYHRDYWLPIRGDDLPPLLSLLVFDAAINSGVTAATRWLQVSCSVRPDGVIGPVTLAAARAPDVPLRFHTRRLTAMADMPTWPAHGRGWAKRMATLPFQAHEFAAGLAKLEKADG